MAKKFFFLMYYKKHNFFYKELKLRQLKVQKHINFLDIKHSLNNTNFEKFILFVSEKKQ